MSPGEQLALGVKALGLRISAETQQKLLDYVALIAKWNRVYNLTAVRDTAEAIRTHLLDSLAVAPHVAGDTVLDVGSGAGLPGLPLAMIWPHARVTVLDSNQKKAAFLRQAVIELGLQNVEVVSERVESWTSPIQFDLVIARAFAEIEALLVGAGRHCAPQGTIAAMKGVYPSVELQRLPAGFNVREVVELKVPGMRAERHLVLLTPKV